MNPFALFNRGIALSGVNERREAQLKQERDDAVAATRVRWRNALLVDQTRAWMAVGGEDRQALVGLSTVLTLAGLSKAFDDGHENSVDVRIIRGAMSAAEQCIKSSGCVISAEYASAFHAAAGRAAEIIDTCSTGAIVHAAQYLHGVAGSGALK